MTNFIFDIIGLVGATDIIVAYLMLQMNKLKVTDRLYSLMNAVGALLIIISLFMSWNLSAFIIEVFWLVISIYGLIKHFRQTNKRSDISN